MSSALELLDRERILAGLTTTAQLALNRLEVFPALDSTNAYLQAGAQEHWPSGAICLAEQQSAGRGRLGRRRRAACQHHHNYQSYYQQLADRLHDLVLLRD